MMLELFIALNMGFIKRINFTNKNSEISQIVESNFLKHTVENDTLFSVVTDYVIINIVLFSSTTQEFGLLAQSLLERF